MVFCYLKQMEKHLKTQAQYWAGNRPGAIVRGMVACHVRLADQLAGPQPSGPIQPRRRSTARERGARTGCTRGVVTVWWPRARWWGDVAGPRAPVDKESQKKAA
jgi:hypothetical protein